MLSHSHIFSGDPMDRADHQRRDSGWIEARLSDPASRFLPFSDMRVLAHAGDAPTLAWLGPDVSAHLDGPAQPVLLGLLEDIAHFGVDMSGCKSFDVVLDAMPGVKFADPRGIAPHLTVAESGILAHAKAIVDWHCRHGFCANCGGPTVPKGGGRERVCDRCRAHHFPRTDPVVIMLVHHSDKCLLGRSQRRVNAVYSALAGFIDQGESIEEAVRREIMEEAGVEVGAVNYHSSQPWPFPSSLMMGCIAEAASTALDMDEHELADVQWFDRQEVLAALEYAGEPGPGLRVPGTIAIAHFLIRDWATGAWQPGLRPGIAPPSGVAI